MGSGLDEKKFLRCSLQGKGTGAKKVYQRF